MISLNVEYACAAWVRISFHVLSHKPRNKPSRRRHELKKNGWQRDHFTFGFDSEEIYYIYTYIIWDSINLSKRSRFPLIESSHIIASSSLTGWELLAIDEHNITLDYYVSCERRFDHVRGTAKAQYHIMYTYIHVLCIAIFSSTLILVRLCPSEQYCTAHK